MSLSFARALGGMLIVVSAVATIPAVVVAFLRFIQIAPPGLDEDPFRSLPPLVRRHLLATWLICLVLAVVGRRIGLRLMRHGRHLVIFLRRFTPDASGAANTVASDAAIRIGGSWRFVALDDASIASTGAGEATATTLNRFERFMEATHTAGTILMTTLKAIAIVTAPVFVVSSLIVWASSGDGGHDWILTLIGIAHTGFAPARWVHNATYVILVAEFAVLAMSIPLAGIVFLLLPMSVYLLSLAAGFDRSERQRDITVTKTGTIYAVRDSLLRATRRVIVPRLTVLSADTSIWKPVVSEVASVAGYALIDVSDPRPSLLWEIDTMLHAQRIPCVFIGEQSAIAYLTTDEPVDPYRRRLRDLLHGHSVLAYPTGAAVTGVFARRLRAGLEQARRGPAVPSLPPLTVATRRADGKRVRLEVRDERGLDRRSPALERIVVRAGWIATTYGRTEVTSSDLLYSWSSNAGGLGHTLLDALVSSGNAPQRPGFRATMAEPDGPHATEFSDEAQTVLRMAFREALRLERPFVDTEHLLLALLSHGDGPRESGGDITSLTRYGITPARARARLVQLLRRRGDAPIGGPYASRPGRLKGALVRSPEAFRKYRAFYGLVVMVAGVAGTLLAIPPTGASCATVYASYPIFAAIGAVAIPLGQLVMAPRTRDFGIYLFGSAFGAGVMLVLGGVMASHDHTLLSSVRACIGLP